MIFTGIQPTGVITLGNYLGSIKNFEDNIDSSDSLICVVDQHAYTIPKDAKTQRENIKSLVALYIAMGLDKKSNIFVQSHVQEHTQLAWILMCNTRLGELDRMTQYKDKSQKKISVSAGLYTYPVLMAADILLYNTKIVPVGIDQKQHVELTRDIAERFNSFYHSSTFVIPEAVINKETAKIYSLVDPTKKMSKSDENVKSYITVLDDEKTILKKVKSATTDSVGVINFDEENQPGVSNLLVIYKTLKNISMDEALVHFKDKQYGFLKEETANAIIEELAPIQKRYYELINDDTKINEVLLNGKNFAQNIASKKIEEVYKTIGLL